MINQIVVMYYFKDAIVAWLYLWFRDHLFGQAKKIFKFGLKFLPQISNSGKIHWEPS